jgi:hypothetical protein
LFDRAIAQQGYQGFYSSRSVGYQPFMNSQPSNDVIAVQLQ